MFRPRHLFTDRTHAGRVLASKLKHYADRPDAIVLALPRGGVPVAYEIARALHLPLDLFLVRKLGVPGHEELAMGAIASGGIRVIDEDLVRTLGIAPSRPIPSTRSASGIGTFRGRATRKSGNWWRAVRPLRRRESTRDRDPSHSSPERAAPPQTGIRRGSSRRTATASGGSRPDCRPRRRRGRSACPPAG